MSLISAAPAGLRDPLEPRPYKLFAASLHEMLPEFVDTPAPIVAQAIADSLGWAWRHDTYRHDGTIDVRCGRTRSWRERRFGVRARPWQLWRQPWITRNYREQGIDYITVDANYGASNPGTRPAAPLWPHNYSVR